MIAPMAAPRPPPNTPPMMAPVAPPTIAPPTGSCAAASCIGIARAMARQAEDPKARINPVLLLIEFHIEIRPNRGGNMGGSSKPYRTSGTLAATRTLPSAAVRSGDVTAIRRVSARNDLVETSRHHPLGQYLGPMARLNDLAA